MWELCVGFIWRSCGVPLAFPNILKVIERPNHGDILRAGVDYEACRSLNQKKCLSLVLFSLKMALWHFLLFF